MKKKYSIEIMTKDKALFYIEIILNIYNKSMDKLKENWDKLNVLIDLPRKWEFSLLLFYNVSLIGFLLGSVYHENILHVHQLSISPEFQNRGLGTKLIKYFINLSKKKGIEMITLESSFKNKKVNKFYEKIGFRMLDDRVLRKYLIYKNKLDKENKYFPTNKSGERVVYFLKLVGDLK